MKALWKIWLNADTKSRKTLHSLRVTVYCTLAGVDDTELTEKTANFL